MECCFIRLQRLQSLRIAQDKGALPEDNPQPDLEAILLKIKTQVSGGFFLRSRITSVATISGCCAVSRLAQVFKQRVRIHEWMHDFDKLNHGRMLKPNFRRALDLCRFGLLESELAILEDQ